MLKWCKIFLNGQLETVKGLVWIYKEILSFYYKLNLKTTNPISPSIFSSNLDFKGWLTNTPDQ